MSETVKDHDVTLENNSIKYTTSPDLVDLMVSASGRLIVDQYSDKAPDHADICYCIYTICHTVLSNKNIRSSSHQMFSPIFIYYLKVYTQIMKEERRNSDTSIDVDKLESAFFTDAALALFEVYIKYPKNNKLRLVLLEACNSLQYIFTEKMAGLFAKNKISVKDHMAYTFSITALTSAIASRTKGLRSADNLPFVAYVAHILQKAFTSNDLSFLAEDDTLKNILVQISSKKKIIRIPRT